MNKTPEYFFNIPELQDIVNVNDLNETTIKIDSLLKQMNAILATRAPINSPIFIGLPESIEPGQTDPFVHSQIATVNYVSNELEVEEIL